jgi:hypothetical protein
MPRFYNVYSPFSDRRRHRFDRRGYASFVLLERFRFPSRECGFFIFPESTREEKENLCYLITRYKSDDR